MTTEHPISPPPELVEKWAIKSPIQYSNETWAYELFIAHQAACWGADQELEACCKWLGLKPAIETLRAARRPKPPSLKEQALLQLDTLNADLSMHGLGCDLSQIRRALEALPDV